MAMVAVKLVPGVNTQKTFADNESGVSQSQLIRYKDNLIQTVGGWTNFVPFTIGSTVRDMHAWEDNAGNAWLGVGATGSLTTIKSGVSYTVTPQTRTSNFTPSFSISSGSYAVSVTDPNSGASIYNTAYFNTPVSIGNLLLNGSYQVASVLSTGSYTITSSVVASTTIASSGMLPVFNTTAGSGVVTVSLANNNFLSILGYYYPLIAATSVGGLTIQGNYLISSVVTSTEFTITTPTQASSTNSATMNGGLAQIQYFVAIGPQETGSGFGAGGFGGVTSGSTVLGGFGSGTSFTGDSGTAITATDWSLDNWGEILLACPKNGPVYAWSATSGLVNAKVITGAPFKSGGIFVSMPQQILVCWAAALATGAQDNLNVAWSDAGDYTNFNVTNATTAGSFHFPTGSLIVGGMQCPTFGLISTDIDAWVMQYVGGDVVFNFTRVGSGCGWIGQHAAGTLSGTTYWCGTNNFFMLGPSGVTPMPCTVWDAIFQNINPSYQSKVKCAVNTAFNEIFWFYPSAASTGENDSYVKVHIEGQEYQWDYGTLPRTAWVDVSVLGMPIGSDTSGTLYQHETGTSITGVGQPSFRTGWWAISEGNDLSFVDWILPDFQWGLRSGAPDAQINVTLYSLDYPGDTAKTYGPYTVTQATQYINVRIRGRLMSMLVQANNNEFFRIGHIRYRAAPAGRR